MGKVVRERVNDCERLLVRICFCCSELIMKHSIILLLGILLGFLALSGFAAELRDAMQQRSMRGSDCE